MSSYMERRLVRVLKEISEVPFTSQNDSDQLRHTIKTIQQHASNAVLEFENQPLPPDNSETNNYRARRLYTCRHIEALCDIIDHLGFEDGKHLPIPDHKMPETPTDVVKNEVKNQLKSTLRLILALNDGYISKSEMQIW